MSLLNRLWSDICLLLSINWLSDSLNNRWLNIGLLLNYGLYKSCSRNICSFNVRWSVEYYVGWCCWFCNVLSVCSYVASSNNTTWQRLVCVTANKICCLYVWSCLALINSIISSSICDSGTLLSFHLIIWISIVITCESITIIITRCHISSSSNIRIVIGIQLWSIGLSLLSVTSVKNVLSDCLSCCVVSGNNILIV